MGEAEDPKELVARQVLARHTIGKDNMQRVEDGGSVYHPTGYAVAAMLEYARLTADRERSVGEDVVERVARALAKRRHRWEAMTEDGRETYRADARVAIAVMPAKGLSSIKPLPEGFALVPKVPTPEMIAAGREVPCDDQITGAAIYSTGVEVRAMWNALIAAAPAPALPETGVGNG